jgi:dihydropteroate synthase
MLLDGATFIDGSLFQSQMQNLYGTRRNFENCSSCKFDSKTFSETIISIDTFRSEVAKASIESGAAIINDISAGNLDDKM